jgi:hypothetical protein
MIDPLSECPGPIRRLGDLRRYRLQSIAGAVAPRPGARRWRMGALLVSVGS